MKIKEIRPGGGVRGHPWHPSLDPPVFMVAEFVNLLPGRDTFLPRMDGLVFITKEL